MKYLLILLLFPEICFGQVVRIEAQKIKIWNLSESECRDLIEKPLSVEYVTSGTCIAILQFVTKPIRERNIFSSSKFKEDYDYCAMTMQCVFPSAKEKK